MVARQITEVFDMAVYLVIVLALMSWGGLVLIALRRTEEGVSARLRRLERWPRPCVRVQQRVQQFSR
jgi:hypothetical protein